MQMYKPLRVNRWGFFSFQSAEAAIDVGKECSVLS